MLFVRSLIDSESSFVQLAPGTSNVILPSPASTKELTALECVNPGGNKPVSRFAPGILAKFGWDHDAEVCALQFVHGRLSVHTSRVLHHAHFPNAVVEPWNWTTKGVWYFFMEECRGVPLESRYRYRRYVLHRTRPHR
jgi:hypothetical protein